MKIDYLIFFCLTFFPVILSATTLNPDTVGLSKLEFRKNEVEIKQKQSLFYDFFTGIYQNKTFGMHPVLGVTLGVKVNKISAFYLATEFRFGKSKNKYDVVVDDSLITTNHFLGEYLGLEYDRLLFSKKHHELTTFAAIGYDWITLPVVNDKTQRNGGIAFNIGLGYLFKFKKGAGPQIKFLYHFANIDNKSGTQPNKNSLSIRISYILGYKK